MTWRGYHEATKHTAELLVQAPHLVDWSNMPDPFRHYEGVPVLDLPADPPCPEIPALSVLGDVAGWTTAAEGATFLSQLLFYSASISASKYVPSTGNRYALRVNPSSGNLHPTEFYFLTRGIRAWPDGLYHYRPSSHMAEQHAKGHPDLPWTDNGAPITFILTSLVWREAWKYGERAYRYCLHDLGHAWQAIAIAAQAIGCETFARGEFPDDDVAEFCRTEEDEWPMLLVEVRGGPIPLTDRSIAKYVWYSGCANQISKERKPFPQIERIHRATKVIAPPLRETVELASIECQTITLPLGPPPPRSFGEIARMRRSALNFVGGALTLSFAQLSTLLATTTKCFSADFASARFVRLYMFAHRIQGVEPGVYRVQPEDANLEQIRSGDQRVIAAGLSLGQELAANACVMFSMIGDMERVIKAYGDRGYRYVHFEAGALGHRLYLTAEALGLGATGIGAFYDDEVHRYLNIKTEEGQVLYHFAIGYPVPDPRLNA